MVRTTISIALAILAARPSSAVGEDLDMPDPRKAGSSKYAFETTYFSLRLGGGILIDYVRYGQGDDSEQQLDLHPESGIRDLRGLAGGRLIWSRLSWTVGYMYDVPANEWRFRQTGLTLQVPELGGNLFVGRTKEGFSTNKLTVGYYGWFNERSAANDAFLPILADGARWTANGFGRRLVYNVGAFADPVSDKEPFNRNDWQVAARAVWLPLATGDQDDPVARGRVLHLAVQGRYAAANDGSLVFRSKPEAFLAQENAVDTGMFEASRSTMIGAEAYYLDGPLSAGFEYYVNRVSSDPTDDPLFHGGEIFVAYMFTGESHPYNTSGAYVQNVVPTYTFFTGGPGAWELAVRCSYVDLDDGTIEGGRFLRATSLVNWYLSETLRLEAAYGYGVLDRFGLEGGIHFFQTRVQLAVN